MILYESFWNDSLVAFHYRSSYGTFYICLKDSIIFEVDLPTTESIELKVVKVCESLWIVIEWWNTKIYRWPVFDS